MRASLFVFLALTIAACGGSTSDNPGNNNDQDAGTGTDDDAGADDAGTSNLPSTSYPATHSAMPQVKNLGGPVIKNAKVLAITFPDDDSASVASIEDFSTKIGASKYWTTIGQEYGVAAATSTGVHYATTLPSKSISDDDIQAFLTAQVGTGLPAGDSSTLYALYYPTGYTITLPHNQGTSCKQFGAYHGEFQTSDGQSRMYAVMPRCKPEFPGETTIDTVTAAASHEYFEAATDPFPDSQPAWSLPDGTGLGWYFLGGGGELGDMCAGLGDVFYKDDEVGYLVQRMWSNAAAKASHDPCIPQQQTPYFNAAPVMPDTDNEKGIGTVPVVKVALNETKTIEVDLFSDAATSGPFSVDVADLAELTGSTAELSVALDLTSGQNGQKANLTITRTAAASQGVSAFVLESSAGGKGTQQSPNLWIGLVE
ncbi:MAG TPA: hypothetical protein VF407_02310 [Polyangiaceae bacterium]